MEGKILILLACIALAQCEWAKEMENVGAFEGDIILDPDEKDNVDSNTYASIKGGRWPGAKIPYEIHSNIESRGRRAIENAIAQYHKNTCIRFIQKTTETAYISFYKGAGCSSPVGYRYGRKNDVSLARGCWTTGIVMHEIGHSIGLYHEQSRPDRDDYVTILWENIVKGNSYNFHKQGASNINSLGTPYDFRSMMHYGSTAFGRGGRRTIETKDPIYQRIIGRRSGFSSIDIKQINLMYCGGDGVKPPSIIPPSVIPSSVLPPSVIPPSATPPSSCDNKEKDCLYWAQKGYCTDQKEAKYMKSNCCKACKESASCANNHSMCDEWQRRGECTKITWVRNNCRKACKFC